MRLEYVYAVEFDKGVKIGRSATLNRMMEYHRPWVRRIINIVVYPTVMSHRIERDIIAEFHEHASEASREFIIGVPFKTIRDFICSRVDEVKANLTKS